MKPADPMLHMARLLSRFAHDDPHAGAAERRLASELLAVTEVADRLASSRDLLRETLARGWTMAASRGVADRARQVLGELHGVVHHALAAPAAVAAPSPAPNLRDTLAELRQLAEEFEGQVPYRL